MRVSVTFAGPLGDYVGERTVQFDLPPEASYGALLREIGSRFGERFPPRIWDEGASDFKAGILVIGAGRDLDSPSIPLMDGEEIKVLPLLAGG
jgi:molybdopterin converting factor small subunit